MTLTQSQLDVAAYQTGWNDAMAGRAHSGTLNEAYCKGYADGASTAAEDEVRPDAD